jgi:hypothetical protein
VRFRGRVTRDPIREWLATHEGSAAVQEAAPQIRFALFGRTGAARRRLARSLWEATSTAAVREAVAEASERYVGAWTPLAYAPSLPRVSIAYRRLVVVPRVMIVWRTASRITTHLAQALDTEVPDSFRIFFAQWVLANMDHAIQRAGPCPQRPLHAEESWACVAVDPRMLWVDASRSGPEWQGHVVLFEMPAPRLPRRDRRELEAAIAELTHSLHNLTRPQRDKTVRVAMDQLASVRV